MMIDDKDPEKEEDDILEEEDDRRLDDDDENRDLDEDSDESDDDGENGEGKKKAKKGPSVKEHLTAFATTIQHRAVDIYHFVIKNFRPTILTSIFTALGFAMLIALGMWQLQRMEWKESLLLKIEERQAKDMIELPPQSMINRPEDMEYRSVKATGEMMFLKSMKLRPRTYDGESGYHIITPLRRETGDIILVNRGWVPEGKEPANTYWRTQNITVEGILTLPEEQGLFTPDNNSKTGEWYWTDLEAMTKNVGVIKLYPLILEQKKSGPEDEYPLGGQTRLDLPNNHFKYALFWFALSFGLVVVWVVYSFQSGIRKNAEEPDEDEKEDEDSDEDDGALPSRTEESDEGEETEENSDEDDDSDGANDNKNA